MKSWKALCFAAVFSIAACGDSDNDKKTIEEQIIDDDMSPLASCPPEGAADCPTGTKAAGNGCEYAGSASTVTITGTAVDFQSDRALSGAIVHMMDNETGKATGVCTVSGSKGDVSLIVPSHQKIGLGTALDSAKDTYQFNKEYTTATDKVEFFSVSNVTAQLIPGIIGSSPDETKGTIAGTVYNKHGDALFEGYTDATTIPEVKVRTKTGQDAFYFNDGDLPSADEEQLNPENALFVLFDIPVGATELELVYGGKVSATTDSKLFSFADSVSISNIICEQCD